MAFFARFLLLALLPALSTPLRAARLGTGAGFAGSAGLASPRRAGGLRVGVGGDVESLDDGSVGGKKPKGKGFLVGPLGKQLQVFTGDYIVHEEHGIGRFLGFSKVEKDSMVVEMRDGELLLPLDDRAKVTRYRSGDDESKRRVVLGSVRDDKRWQQKLNKVRVKTQELAAEVVSLYASRSKLSRPPCRPDAARFDGFDEAFGHTPTKDQMQCFRDVELDMCWRKSPMDRLICGDVGFGKTEVAMRALNRAVSNGRQCAVLAPTTVLAAQHHRTMTKRMPDARIVLLTSRVKPKEAAQIRERVEAGEVDIVIGTHAILSGRTKFSNLKLLVIDEEQRFGVAHKERLKAVAEGLDVLTLSATPIPRTLQMSLTGMRDMSTILTPPPERQEITTAVNKFNETLVELVIKHEMERDGQTIIVVPKIQNLDAAKEIVERVAPSAKVLVAHGRLKGLEDVVCDFSEGKGDVLLATTVVENGLDIPTVNSMIVLDAQSFGLSSLYQLRGRVGRRNRKGIALFLYPDRARLSTDALRRLAALKELGLGSGFDLSHRDLEIRGAGSVVGVKQSGFISQVGYDLYCDMFTDAIQDLRGSAILPTSYCAVDVTGVAVGDETENPLPAGDFPDPEVRAAQYERLRLSESFDELRKISNEWFELCGGGLSEECKALLKAAHVKVAAHTLGASALWHEEERDEVVMEVPELTPKIWDLWRRGAHKAVEGMAYVEAQGVEDASKNGRADVRPPRLVIEGAFGGAAVEGRSELLLKRLFPLVTYVAKASKEALERFERINEELMTAAEEEKEEKERKRILRERRPPPPLPPFPEEFREMRIQP